MNRDHIGKILLLIFFLITGTPAYGQNPPASQLYYVPFPEDRQLEAFRAITTVAVEPIAVFVTIAAASNDTVIYYDHWEDGYEADLTNPRQSTTLIFGDGNQANGFPPGNPSDRIPAGTVFNLRNFVTTTTLGAVIDYDAGDKIGSFKPITVTKTTFPGGTNTLLAGCVEIFERGLWGTEYRTPVGIDMPVDAAASPANSAFAFDENLFEYTALSISAGKGGASVQIDRDNNGVFEETVVLTEGQSVYRADFNVGGRVLASRPVQVVLFTGAPGSTYASRDSSLLPSFRWGSEYYSPVSTRTSPKDGTVVFLHNPNPAAITISYQYRSDATTYVTNTVNVPGGGNVRVDLQPAGTNHLGAYRFFTTGANPPVFNAIGTVDADDVRGNGGGGAGTNNAWDGGFTLVTRASLTTQVQVSLGIGRDPYSSVNPTENGNPVWITTSGNGDTASTVYVDYNGDLAGPLVDPNGNRYDVAYSLRELQQQILYDPDGDQSGMVVYSLDPGVRIAAVWAQDPSTASAGQPGLDVASLVPPMREGDAGKKSTVFLDKDGDGFASAGDTLEYDIRAASNARANIPGPFRVRDTLPGDVTYVPGTVRYRYTVGGSWQTWTNVSDDGAGTPFPLDGAGFSVPGSLQMGQQMQVTFRAVIDEYADLAGPTIVNTGDVEISPYGLIIPIEWEDILYGSIGDRIWTDTNGNGVQNTGELGLAGIRVYADTNSNGSHDVGEPTSITDSTGNYLLTGLLAGTYTVRVDSNAISAINPGYGPTFDLDGIATSHVSTVVLAAAQQRKDADFGYRIGASVGDRVWMDRDNDGVQENGEPGINGVRVYVDSNNNGAFNAGEPNTFTSGDGNYFIGNLNPGTFEIRVDTTTLPGGATQTFDANGTLDNRAQVIFIGSEHNGTMDFGYRGTQSIGDLVWDDVNADGTRVFYNVVNGRIDLNGDGDGTNDNGSIGTVNIIGGQIDLNGDGSANNSDDGVFQGFTVINSRLDTNLDGSANGDDDATGVIANEVGLANVRVYIDSNGNGTFDANEASSVTDASGIYSIGNLFNGT